MPWPSFPSFVRDPQKRDAVPVLVPLDGDRGRPRRGARGGHARARGCVFIATPNNPTGRGRAARRADRVRQRPARARSAGDRRGVLRLSRSRRPVRRDRRSRARRETTCSRCGRSRSSTAWRASGSGYGVGPAAVVAAMRKVQRGYDVGALAQVAALASLGDDAEVERRRDRKPGGDRRPHGDAPGARARAAVGQRDQLRARRRRERTPIAPPSAPRRRRRVQSGAPFGAPTSLRIGAGSTADLALLDAALAAAGFGAALSRAVSAK